VAAFVRSAAPVRRHQKLISGLEPLKKPTVIL
jgi:hypothetical protein